MQAVIQRVDSASVTESGVIAGSIDKGILVLLGVFDHDTREDAEVLAKKVANLRIFCDENDKMNLSVLDVGGGALVISNFTLCANTKKGNRPSFASAMEPNKANQLYEHFVKCLKENMVSSVQCGVFGGDMHIDAALNGPVTILLDTLIWRKK